MRAGMRVLRRARGEVTGTTPLLGRTAVPTMLSAEENRGFRERTSYWRVKISLVNSVALGIGADETRVLKRTREAKVRMREEEMRAIAPISVIVILYVVACMFVWVCR